MSAESATFRYEPGLLAATTASGRAVAIYLPDKHDHFVGALVAAKGRVLHRDHLVAHIYPGDHVPASARILVRYFAYCTRLALAENGIREDYLVNEYGCGYAWAGRTEVSHSPRMVPLEIEAALRRCLARDTNREEAATVRLAVFGR